MQIRLEVFCTKLLTDTQTNNDENITSLAEVINVRYLEIEAGDDCGALQLWVAAAAWSAEGNSQKQICQHDTVRRRLPISCAKQMVVQGQRTAKTSRTTKTYLWGKAFSLWPPCIADAVIIFLPCGFFLLLSSIFFYSSPNLSGRRLDVYHIPTHGVALVRI